MGKGDSRSRRGKLFSRSYGNTRLKVKGRTAAKAAARAGKPVTKTAPKVKAAPKAKPAAKSSK